MQEQIETEIKNLHTRIAIKSNFQKIYYTAKELKAHCRRISKLHQTLTYLVLVSGIPVSADIIPRVEQIKRMAC